LTERPHSAEAAGEPGSRTSPGGLSPLEALVDLALLGFGLYVASSLRAYEVGSPLVVAVALGCVASSWLVCWLGLRMLDVPRNVASAASLRAQLAWNVLLLGQFPYIGYMMAPFELLIAATLMRRRAGLGSWWQPVLIALCARSISLLLVEVLRQNIGSWR
jgi:hypothetical protein